MQIVALDIETYGICKCDHLGRILPAQTVYNPRRSVEIDGCPRESLVLTCAITTCDNAPSKGPLDGAALARLRPSQSRVFLLHREDHRILLRRWLDWADVILGMNLQFDVQYLRFCDPRFRLALSGRQQLIDAAVLDFLYASFRRGVSLKAMGPILQAYRYDEIPGEKAYSDPLDPRLHHYNASDTHASILAVATFAERIIDEFGPNCLDFRTGN